MFNGFPSTQTPTVQWWDFSNVNNVPASISLANDCAPVQYFVTGGLSTSLQVTLPVSPPQGKVITIKNDMYGSSTQRINIVYANLNTPGTNCFSILGPGASITLCYIAQNTVKLNATYTSPWVQIAGTPVITGINQSVNFGYNSTSTAQFSSVGGGSGNVASGTTSNLSGGLNNTVSGSSGSIGGGSNHNVTGSNATVGGGNSNTSNSQGSTISGGGYGSTRAIVGYTSFPSCYAPIVTTSGSTQAALLVLAGATTDATPKILTSDPQSVGTTNQVILPNNAAYFFRGEVVAGVTGAGNTKGWTIEGVIKRGANAASTTLVGTPTVTSLYADAGAATWSIAVTADTTNGGLKVEVTGQAATTIRWVAQICTTEMTF
jgi:hypothetical protein